MSNASASIAPPTSRRGPWQIPDFRSVFAGIAVWEAGSWSYSVILTAYIYTDTGSAAAVAWVAVSRWVPAFVVAPYAGVIADRFERRRVMLCCASATFLVMLAMGGLVAAGAPLAALVALSIANIVLESPNRPAYGALLPEVVGEKDLAAANATMNVLENVVTIVGPLLGSVLIIVADPTTAILLNASSYAVAALLISRISSRSTGDAGKGAGALAQMREGLNAILVDRLVLTLVAACVLCSAVYGAYAVLLPALSESLGTGGTGYGYLLAAASVGSIGAALVTARLARRIPVGPLVVGALMVEALPFAVLAVDASAPLAAAALLVSGAAMTVVDIVTLTALQRAVPAGLLGRALASTDAAVIAGIAVAGAASGVLADRWGLQVTLGAIAIGFGLFGLLCIPGFRGARASICDPDPDQAARLDLLQRLDLFAGATRAALARLAEVATPVEAPAGSTVIRQSEAAEHLWVLVEGRLGASTPTACFPEVSAPGYVGELGLLHGTARTATVLALTHTRLLRIDGTEFLAVLNAAAPSSSLARLADERARRTR